MKLKRIESPDTFQAYLLSVAALPLKGDEIEPVRQWWDRLTRAAVIEWKMAEEIFLQLEHLHQDGGAQRLAENASDWIPNTGLGVWPNRPPPTMWNNDDFKFLGIGERPRTFMHQVIHIGAERSAREQARNAMLGIGSVVQLVAAEEGQILLDYFKNLLLPTLKEPTFRGFPFFIPLLEAKCVSEASTAQLKSWLGKCSLYVRESPEDRGILVVSSRPVENLFAAIGCDRIEGSESEWALPTLSA